MQIEADSRFNHNTVEAKPLPETSKQMKGSSLEQSKNASFQANDKKQPSSALTSAEENKEQDSDTLSSSLSEAAELQEAELQAAVKTISSFMNVASKNVNFQQDEQSDKTIIKVFDAQTKELIKQFPSEEILDIAQKIVELRQDVGLKTGILLDEEV